MIRKLLRRNTSPARVVGFVLSNFIGLTIVLGALQFYRDAGSIWTSEDSFVKSDYLIINKRVTTSNTLGGATSGFTDEEIADIKGQPWCRKVGLFSSCKFRVYAGLQSGDRTMTTSLFFESIPDEFVDVPRQQWEYRSGSNEVPIIMAKDYLTLYNFGFASSAGLPQLSEGLMGSIPMTLRLSSEDGEQVLKMHGRVAGFSNRLNTILVPQQFMDEMNRTLGSGVTRQPSRLIIDVSSPGDVAITQYLESHDWEVAGDKSASSASFLLRVIVGIVAGVGGLITLLSLFILILSISLIMEKNRDILHSLLMLGYDAGSVGRPYIMLAVTASVVAYLLSVVAILAMRAYYLTPIEGLGGVPTGLVGTLLIGAALTGVIILLNVLTVRRRVRASFYK